VELALRAVQEGEETGVERGDLVAQAEHLEVEEALGVAAVLLGLVTGDGRAALGARHEPGREHADLLPREELPEAIGPKHAMAHPGEPN
jgi:hypothetical protein